MSSTCAACDAPDAEEQCTGCRRVRYCGAPCQRAHWQAHKKECRAAVAACEDAATTAEETAHEVSRCRQCERELPQSDFAKSQFKKPTDERRCRACAAPPASKTAAVSAQKCSRATRRLADDPPATPPLPQRPSPASEAAFDRGEIAFAGDIATFAASALEAYTEAIALAPTVAKYRLKRGQLHYMLSMMSHAHDYRLAARDLRWAIHIEPTSSLHACFFVVFGSRYGLEEECIDIIDAFMHQHGGSAVPEGTDGSVTTMKELRPMLWNAVQERRRSAQRLR
jgi:hypothetical protein